jgi:hypothetical protein
MPCSKGRAYLIKSWGDQQKLAQKREPERLGYLKVDDEIAAAAHYSVPPRAEFEDSRLQVLKLACLLGFRGTAELDYRHSAT